MTSAVEKKGDVVDLFIELKEKGLLGDPSHIGDYPETVLTTLKAFIKVFQLPNGAIPSKRSKSKYTMWIKGLQELEQICPVGIEECMQLALKTFDNMGRPFLIYQPQSITKLLINAVAERNRLAEQEKEVEELHSQTFADPKAVSKSLGSLFENED
jgi:hypothetical protein